MPLRMKVDGFQTTASGSLGTSDVLHHCDVSCGFLKFVHCPDNVPSDVDFLSEKLASLLRVPFHLSNKHTESFSN